MLRQLLTVQSAGMNDADMPNLVPIYCGGHLFTVGESRLLESRCTGGIGERVCIHLKKPKSRMITIKEENRLISDREPSTTGVIDVCRTNYSSTLSKRRNQGPFIVAGTTKFNKIRVYSSLYPHLRSRPEFYSGLGFKDELRVVPLTNKQQHFDVYNTPKYSYNAMDLKEIFHSECIHPDDADRQINVQCVVQQKRDSKQSSDKIRFKKGCTEKKILGLNRSSVESEKDICDLIRTQLPRDLYTEIMKYMNYDQVSWLVDNDERFARKLANERYKIKSYNRDIFPNISSLLPALRKEAAKEMRFSRKEDLWLVSFSDYNNPGVAKRFAVVPGIYKWHSVTPITSMRFDSCRSKCEICTEKLVLLQKAKAENQEKIMIGVSQMKIFSLEGSEDLEIDTRYTSPYYRDSKSCDYDYSVHMWVEDVDNKWLQDVQVIKERLDLEEYLSFADYNTLIFKDPVKFFGTSKVVDIVDNGILALTSKMTGEVVGYLVDDEEVRLRVPLCAQDRIKITGLNFLPPALYKEMRASKELIQHVRYHEVESEINRADERLRSLREALLRPLRPLHPLDDFQNALDIGQNIEATISHIHNLQRIRNNSYELNIKFVIKERIDDTVHIHEVYEEDVDFCTVYAINITSASDSLDVIKRNTKIMFTRCSYERRNPDKICSLKVMNPIGLRSMYAVKTGLTLETDLA